MVCAKIAQAQSPSISHREFMLLGLTGGMGCGKSTAARIFEEFGFTRLDADEVVRQHVLTDTQLVETVAARYGDAVLNAEGNIDRGALARRVFADEAELHWLEQQVHPKLFAYWRTVLRERPGKHWVFEVPLLFEKRLENWFDFTVCVATTSAHQYARLEERGMSHALAEQRITKQLPLAHKLESADLVLLNDGSTTFLRDQIAALVAAIGANR